ncbi:hypothetical protein ACKTEK_06190 [Tepidamorphus sp. 3E244]|uniref:hypothetical protein n=1 Tax=Tepidamorphus sp. 3E244 TaxID=3385498 RepID=UPI0038FC0706
MAASQKESNKKPTKKNERRHVYLFDWTSKWDDRIWWIQQIVVLLVATSVAGFLLIKWFGSR